MKAKTGKFAYWVAGWSLLGKRLAEFDVEIAGERRRCSFALLSKVRNYGGDFEIARSVTLLDDQFEVVLFEGATATRYVKYFAGMALNRLAGMSGVTVLRADQVTISPVDDRRLRADRRRVGREAAGGDSDCAERADAAGAGGVRRIRAAIMMYTGQP